jgi:hypothetical protein
MEGSRKIIILIVSSFPFCSARLAKASRYCASTSPFLATERIYLLLHLFLSYNSPQLQLSVLQKGSICFCIFSCITTRLDFIFSCYKELTCFYFFSCLKLASTSPFFATERNYLFLRFFCLETRLNFTVPCLYNHGENAGCWNLAT